MNRPVILSSALLALSLTLGACSAGSAAGNQTTPPSPGPGKTVGSALTGKVTDLQGHPIKGAKINADNTVEYDSNIVGYSGADGTYTLDLGLLPVTWNITAYLDLKYNGWDVPVKLKTSNPEVVPGGPNGGGVRNFTYAPEVTAANPYGDLGKINMSNAFGETGVDFKNVILTITPVGTLADGSKGSKMTVKPVQTGDGWIVANVMYGTYTVSATAKGVALSIRPVLTDGTTAAWEDEYTGGFTWPYWATRPTMFIELSNSH